MLGFLLVLNNKIYLLQTKSKIKIEDSKYYIWHVVVNYQWNIGKQLFLSSGLMAGIHYNYGGEECHYGNCFKTSEKSGYILPTISLDYRF